MALRLIVFALAYVGAAQAQWERYVGTPQGEVTDKPPAFPLSYFTTSGCLGARWIERDRECTSLPYASLKIIGRVGRFTIDEVAYYTSADLKDTASPDSKSVVVESEPGLFHEIYFRTLNQVDAIIKPAELIEADGQTILCARYWSGGHPGVSVDHYFSFGAAGTRLMHPEKMREAAEKKIPPDSAIDGGYVKFADLTWRFGVGSPDPWRRPNDGARGWIVVHFKIDGDFMPVSAEFIPDSRAH